LEKLISTTSLKRADIIFSIRERRMQKQILLLGLTAEKNFFIIDKILKREKGGH